MYGTIPLESNDALSLDSTVAIPDDIKLIAVARAKGATKDFTGNATGAVY
eukprot:CAMPEP_0202019522 /NCGR_PEP_ID=MMETSP0905-20130828/42278_1 /ASSEMBLY_ACC=CAM_ASM_000554 /TAXON_ID=420261 /ORGANISM="Thalassiosira antarctica, Strain CCMP982" /LENGTH=49 /DNA_ID= /DNA_START= /DNA_END= /DNA_ORIENTATION=